MKHIAILLIILSLGGCASAIDRHSQLNTRLALPVDCSNAESDVATLRSNRASTGEQFLNGLASVMPTSALLNIVTGEFSSRLAIAFGGYNRKVDEKINRINASCNHLLIASK